MRTEPSDIQYMSVFVIPSMYVSACSRHKDIPQSSPSPKHRALLSLLSRLLNTDTSRRLWLKDTVYFCLSVNDKHTWHTYTSYTKQMQHPFKPLVIINNHYSATSTIMWLCWTLLPQTHNVGGQQTAPRPCHAWTSRLYSTSPLAAAQTICRLTWAQVCWVQGR